MPVGGGAAVSAAAGGAAPAAAAAEEKKGKLNYTSEHFDLTIRVKALILFHYYNT